MADNIQRSSGRPSNYKFDRGGTPAESGPFIGIVKNNIDPTRSGRLQVYIEQFAGDNPDDSSLWRTVMYCPPFYGVTPRNQASGSAGDGSYKGNQQSYGMWFTPPDVGVQVICVFVAGDPNQGYYFGCVPEAGVFHMVPAIGASRNFTAKNDQQETEIANAEAEQLPVVEINAENEAASQSPRFFDQPKPVHDYVYTILYNQGLLGDYIRGPISSSAQRESPSAVFGFSTPGRPIYQGGLGESDIKQKVDAGEVELDDVKVEGRRGGHTIVLDDGDLRGRDNLIRLRTAKGHQITMSDEADCLYIIAANGQTWIELGSEGTVDVYSTNSVNVRSQGEINLHADKDININAGENLNIRGNNINVESQEKTSITSTSDFVLYSKSKIGVKSDGSINLDSKQGGWLSQTLALRGSSRIDLNGGASPASVSAPTALTEYVLDDTKLEPGTGWVVQPGAIESIVPRAPTHEPYPYHNKGVPVEIEIAAGSASSSPPAVQNAVDSTANTQMETPPAAESAAPVPSDPATVNSVNTVSNAQAAEVGPISSGAPFATATAIDPSDVLTTPKSSVAVGSLSRATTTGLLAQTRASVGQSSDTMSVNKGIGKYGMQTQQLEAAGYLKPGTTATLNSKSSQVEVTEADELEAARIQQETNQTITPEQVAQNRKQQELLRSGSYWTGKDSVGSIDDLLQNDPLQDRVQQTLMANSLDGLQTSGLATGTESPNDLSPLVQSATILGVGAVASFVNGAASADVAAQIGAQMKGAQYSTSFMENKIGDFAGFARPPKPGTATVDRTALDGELKNSLGDPKIPTPQYRPVEREPDVPTPESEKREEFDELVTESTELLDTIQEQFNELVDRQVELQSQQPLTSSQISQFESSRSQIEQAYLTGKTDSVDALTAFYQSSANDDIRDYMDSFIADINRTINLLQSLNRALKEQVERWKLEAAASS